MTFWQKALKRIQVEYMGITIQIQIKNEITFFVIINHINEIKIQFKANLQFVK